jgi:hypothetical protein
MVFYDAEVPMFFFAIVARRKHADSCLPEVSGEDT